MVMKYYTLHILGLTRELPLIKVGKNTSIASFSILGDVELTDKLADALTEKLKTIEFDYLVGPEVKVLPLIHGIAKRLGQKRFVICRKSKKPYMISPIVVEPLKYFPKHVKPLVINGPDVELIKGKKVVVIDDIVSTGVTMRMITHLMETLGAHVVHYAAALKQGTQFNEIQNLISIAELPIFKDSDENSSS
jgi:adenine phosphoribosyltransferase